MYIVNVHVHVRPEHREGFIEATLDNARNTVQEPGNLRFDVLQQLDDPNRFVIYEVYRDDAALAAHKASAHYARWAAVVNPWMAETRYGVKFAPLFPEQPERFRVQL
jgi:(4S)-4-hydroxy-5-phosphonooxypentane-2,3-dione isomerase